MLVQTRVRIICGLLVATILLLGGSGVLVAARLLDAQHRSQLLTTVQRHHLNAGMFHDALRSDVLESLYRASYPDNPAAVAQRNAELRRDITRLQQAIEANQQLAVSDDLKRALLLVRGPLVIYIAAALDVTDLAPHDSAAAARKMDDFDAKYDVLDRLMTDASTQLESDLAANVEAVSRVSGLWTKILLLSALFGLGVVAWVTRVLVTRIVAPVRRLTAALADLTAGKIDVTVVDADSEDEIGQLGKGLQAFREAVVAARAAETAGQSVARERFISEQRAAAARDAQQHRRDELEAMAAALEARVLAAARRMLAAASGMQSVAQSMGENAGATLLDAGTAATASAQSASSMQSVAVASGQLSGAIANIAGRIQASSAAARHITDRVADAQRLGIGLTEAADRIGRITTLISDVAHHTNLLALNASIEAAQAGAAGHGFAVVAQEVKNLASQTEAATGEIAAEVDAVRRNAAAVAEAVTAMLDVSAELEAVASSVASAVEQQNSATAAIDRSVHDSAAGLDALQHNIAGVREQAQATEATAREVTESAASLGAEIETLSGEVSEFISRVRAA